MGHFQDICPKWHNMEWLCCNVLQCLPMPFNNHYLTFVFCQNDKDIGKKYVFWTFRRLLKWSTPIKQTRWQWFLASNGKFYVFMFLCFVCYVDLFCLWYFGAFVLADIFVSVFSFVTFAVRWITLAVLNNNEDLYSAFLWCISRIYAPNDIPGKRLCSNIL